MIFFIAKNLSLLIQTNLDKKLVKNSIEKMIKTLYMTDCFK